MSNAYTKTITTKMSKEVSAVTNCPFTVDNLRRFVATHEDGGLARSKLLAMSSAVERAMAEHYPIVVEAIADLVVQASADQLSAATLRFRKYTDKMHVEAMSSVYSLMPKVYNKVKQFLATHEKRLLELGVSKEVLTPQALLMPLYEYVASEARSLASLVVSDASLSRVMCADSHKSLAVTSAKHLLGIDVADADKVLSSVLSTVIARHHGVTTSFADIEDVSKYIQNEQDSILALIERHQEWGLAPASDVVKLKTVSTDPFYARVSRAAKASDNTKIDYSPDVKVEPSPITIMANRRPGKSLGSAIATSKSHGEVSE